MSNNNDNNGVGVEDDIIGAAIAAVTAAGVGPTDNDDLAFVGDKVKGAWSAEEDIILSGLVAHFGPKNWNLIARGIPGRTGKSCRLRWCNQLDPAVERKPFTPEEDILIMQAHSLHGNKWAAIAKLLPGRRDNAIKNYWHSSLSRRIAEHGKNNLNPANTSEDVTKASSKETQLSEVIISEHAEDQSNNKSPVEIHFSAQQWVPNNLFRPVARVSTFSMCNTDPIDVEVPSVRGSALDAGVCKFLKGACGERVIPSNCGHGCCETDTGGRSQKSLLGPAFVDYDEPPSIPSHGLAAIAAEINNIAWQKSGLEKSSVMVTSSGLNL